MVEANDLEMFLTVVFAAVVGFVLVWADIFPDLGTVIVFASMALIGFLTVRTIRGRKWSWR